MIPTIALAQGWSKQHEVYPENQWVKRYWDSSDRNHRTLILTALESLGEFSSVLELGCNTGPNLKRIHERWPRVDLAGVDVNSDALTYGREAAHNEGWDFTTCHGTFLDALTGPRYDVVLTCYSLCYLDQEDIDPILAASLACAKVGVVIAEPMVLNEDEGICNAPIPEYHYNYFKRLPKGRTKGLFKVSPPEHHLNYILTFPK